MHRRGMTDPIDEPGLERPEPTARGVRVPRRRTFGRAMRETNPYARALEIALAALEAHVDAHGPVQDPADFIVRATPSPERLREIEAAEGLTYAS